VYSVLRALNGSSPAGGVDFGFGIADTTLWLLGYVDEEEAYWIMRAMTHWLLPDHFSPRRPGFRGIRVTQAIAVGLVRSADVRVARMVQAHSDVVHGITAAHLHSLFTACSSASAAAHLWDWMLYQMHATTAMRADAASHIVASSAGESRFYVVAASLVAALILIRCRPVDTVESAAALADCLRGRVERDLVPSLVATASDLLHALEGKQPGLTVAMGLHLDALGAVRLKDAPVEQRLLKVNALVAFRAILGMRWSRPLLSGAVVRVLCAAAHAGGVSYDRFGQLLSELGVQGAALPVASTASSARRISKLEHLFVVVAQSGAICKRGDVVVLDALQLVVMVSIASCDSLEAKLTACVRVAAARRLANGAAAAAGDASTPLRDTRECEREDGVDVCDALAQTWLYRKGSSDAAAVTQSSVHDVASILLGGVEDVPASTGPASANACAGGVTPPRIERVVATLAAYPFVCRASVPSRQRAPFRGAQCDLSSRMR
jgi:hypothetical protein